MNKWKEINEVNMFYIKYNVLPNLIAFGLAYSYYNKIDLNCGMRAYFNNVFSLFNIVNINIKDQFKLADNILINKYKLMIIKVNPIEIIKIRKWMFTFLIVP